MSDTLPLHSHVFLGGAHTRNEARTWVVIWLCGCMMAAEITGGLLFGSVALVADGLHMSTHAGALLLAALAYTYARRHAEDARFTFGTGKLGDLAGFTSAIVLAMIAALIGYEAIARLFAPVAIDYREALGIAALGLLVNIASAWLLSGGEHGHHHHHGAGHDHPAAETSMMTASGPALLSIFEDGVPPRFRLQFLQATPVTACAVTIETERPDGARQTFAMRERAGFVESIEEIPEPHAFTASIHLPDDPARHRVVFEEHEHGDAKAHRDNNMRAALIHVIADAAVSVLVISGLALAWAFGWVWMDPLAGLVGAIVIANWSYGLARDTGAILLDMNPDQTISERIRTTLEADGARLADLHLWRLGPGHLGAIVSVVTKQPRSPDEYRARLAHLTALSHVTVEVRAA
jgi:cation diffusion facilitator family transporter